MFLRCAVFLIFQLLHFNEHTTFTVLWGGTASNHQWSTNKYFSSCNVHRCIFNAPFMHHKGLKIFMYLLFLFFFIRGCPSRSSSFISPYPYLTPTLCTPSITRTPKVLTYLVGKDLKVQTRGFWDWDSQAILPIITFPSEWNEFNMKQSNPFVIPRALRWWDKTHHLFAISKQMTTVIEPFLKPLTIFQTHREKFRTWSTLIRQPHNKVLETKISHFSLRNNTVRGKVLRRISNNRDAKNQEALLRFTSIQTHIYSCNSKWINNWFLNSKMIRGIIHQGQHHRAENPLNYNLKLQLFLCMGTHEIFQQLLPEISLPHTKVFKSCCTMFLFTRR